MTPRLRAPLPSKSSPMNALVYHETGRQSLQERPVPQIITPTDAIVRVARTTICSTDLISSKATFRLAPLAAS
jgi:threonine dehydrogenase-like Zn-dependent dehydrogenase